AGDRCGEAGPDSRPARLRPARRARRRGRSGASHGQPARPPLGGHPRPAAEAHPPAALALALAVTRCIGRRPVPPAPVDAGECRPPPPHHPAPAPHRGAAPADAAAGARGGM
ncbi:MAG: hypothetical protein AVDCRST_MAG27-141, partial [uncultured Craurococcus sp.]